MDDLRVIASAIWLYLPTIAVHSHILLAAIIPIYTSAYASLSRPSSAEKPEHPSVVTDGGEQADSEEEDGEDDIHEMESLSATDAILFPIIAALVLILLYYLIKRFGADVINSILAWYFAGVVISGIGKLFSDGAELVLSFVFPIYYKDQGQIWQVRGQSYETISTSSKRQTRSSPLPGMFGRARINPSFAGLYWRARSALKQKYAVEVYVKTIVDLKSKFTVTNFLSHIGGLVVVIYSNFIAKPWWLTNIQGFAVSYFAMQFLSPTSFPIGSLVLAGLFFYDIWAVFFTEYMVFAATKLDQPIKLMFPRPSVPEDDAAQAYNLLGLGDIVLPGLMLGLALRFDLYMFYLRKQVKSADQNINKAAYTSANGHWGSLFWIGHTPIISLPLKLQNARFPKPYFTASLAGYISGMLLTLEIMTFFKHAQPALLYLVPAVLLSIWITALARGELKEMIAYTEGITGEADEKSNGNSNVRADYSKTSAAGDTNDLRPDSSELEGKSNDEKISQQDNQTKISKGKNESNCDPNIFLHLSIKRHTRSNLEINNMTTGQTQVSTTAGA